MMPEADPGSHPQKHEVGDALSDAPRRLAQGGQVDVVLEADVPAQLGANGLDQARLAAGQVGAEGEPGAGRVEHAGQAHGGVGDARPGQAALSGQFVGETADLGDGGRGAAVRALVTAGADGAGDVCERRAHPVAADVDADHPARLRIQLVDDGSRPLGAL